MPLRLERYDNNRCSCICLQRLSFQRSRVCSVIAHRWRQNVVRTKEWHLTYSLRCHWCYCNMLTSSMIYYRTDPEQHGIIQYILTWNLFINQTLSVQRNEHLKFWFNDGDKTRIVICPTVYQRLTSRTCFDFDSGQKYCCSEGKGPAFSHSTSCKGNCFTKPNHSAAG